MSSFIYQQGQHLLGGRGGLDIQTANANDEIYLGLMSSSYPADDSHRVADQYYSDILDGSYELNTAGGYVGGDSSNAGGQLFDNGSIKVVREDITFSDHIEFTLPVIWGLSTLTAAYAFTYRWTGDASTSDLLFLWDFGGTRVTNNRDFVVSWLDTIAHTFGPCPAS